MPGCRDCFELEGGNLPKFNKNTFKGNSWNPCPYSTQSSDIRSTAMLGGVPIKVDHTDDSGMIYYLSPSVRGEWGYVCTFSGCPYVQTIGSPYFYR